MFKFEEVKNEELNSGAFWAGVGAGVIVGGGILLLT
jgi:hypothetical protein